MRNDTTVTFLALVFVLALILGVTAVSLASAQSEEEDENEQLARQMTGKLAELEKQADKIAKVDEDDVASIDTKAPRAILDWLGARVREIKKSDDRGLARQAGKLATAVKEAQDALGGLARGDTTPKQANIDLQNVVGIGEDLVAIMGKNN